VRILKKRKLVYGIGINDSDYSVYPKISGMEVICPYYRAWANMIRRCYCAKLQAKYPTYTGCSVVPEWHSFMTFRAWMIEQPWEGNDLDKDILFPGNKVYGPNTCVFISHGLNSFTTESASARGEWPIGADWHKRAGKFRASCRNPFTGKQEHLGLFTCPNEAHEAWRTRKHEHALALAAQQTDPRVAKALSTRYLKEGDAK
jgi:hypothetical protein